MSFSSAFLALISSVALVVVPTTAAARADGWYTFDTKGAPVSLPNGTMPLEHQFTVSSDTIRACFSKDDDWNKCGNYRDPTAYHAEREANQAAAQAAPVSRGARSCVYTPDPVRYTPPADAVSPNGYVLESPCSKGQVDTNYVQASGPCLAQRPGMSGVWCEWYLRGTVLAAQAAQQPSAPQPVQQPVARKDHSGLVVGVIATAAIACAFLCRGGYGGSLYSGPGYSADRAPSYLSSRGCYQMVRGNPYGRC